MWGYMGNQGWGYGWGLLGMTQMVLWWVLPILGIVVLAKWLLGRGSDQSCLPINARWRSWPSATRAAKSTKTSSTPRGAT